MKRNTKLSLVLGLVIFLTLAVPAVLVAADGGASTGWAWWDSLVKPLILPVVMALLVAFLVKKWLDTPEKRERVYRIITLADEFIEALLVNHPTLKWAMVLDDVLDEFAKRLLKEGLTHDLNVAERALKAAYTRATGPGEEFKNGETPMDSDDIRKIIREELKAGKPKRKK